MLSRAEWGGSEACTGKAEHSDIQIQCATCFIGSIGYQFCSADRMASIRYSPRAR
jgi:hypothetical protein